MSICEQFAVHTTPSYTIAKSALQLYACCPIELNNATTSVVTYPLSSRESLHKLIRIIVPIRKSRIVKFFVLNIGDFVVGNVSIKSLITSNDIHNDIIYYKTL